MTASPFPKDLKGGFTLGQASGRISSSPGTVTISLPPATIATAPAPESVSTVVTPVPVTEFTQYLPSVAPTPSALPDGIQFMHKLIDLPGRIAEAAKGFDEADRHYKAQLSVLTIRAFSVALFPGKKPEDPLRPAGNDTEREAAIQSLITSDPTLETYALVRESAVRDLTRLRSEFEAIKLAMQYLISK